MDEKNLPCTTQRWKQFKAAKKSHRHSGLPRFKSTAAGFGHCLLPKSRLVQWPGRNYIVTWLIPRRWGLSHHATLIGLCDPVLPPLVELLVFFSPEHRLPSFVLVLAGDGQIFACHDSNPNSLATSLSTLGALESGQYCSGERLQLASPGVGERFWTVS